MIEYSDIGDTLSRSSALGRVGVARNVCISERAPTITSAPLLEPFLVRGNAVSALYGS